MVAGMLVAAGSATAALVVTGAMIANGTITSADVRDRALRGSDLADNTVAGRQVAEASLVGVNAAKLGGRTRAQLASDTATTSVKQPGIDWTVVSAPGGVTSLADPGTSSLRIANGSGSTQWLNIRMPLRVPTELHGTALTMTGFTSCAIAVAGTPSWQGMLTELVTEPGLTAEVIDSSPGPGNVSAGGTCLELTYGPSVIAPVTPSATQSVVLKAQVSLPDGATVGMGPVTVALAPA